MMLDALAAAAAVLINLGSVTDPHEVPNLTPRLKFCTTAASDGDWFPLRDHQRQLALIQETKTLPPESFFKGFPFDCRLVAEVRCVPDMDGDGSPEFLARLGWEEPPAPVEILFLQSR